ncbi:MAG: hypothetical protein R3D57_10660 [Hyphomicrobiaceae bacterium]
MSVSLYEGRAYDANRFVRLMAVVNVAFACVVLFAWPQIAGLLDTPVSVAADAGIASRPEFSEYPYVLLWSLPILGSLAAWIATRSEKFLFAKFLAAYPAIVILAAVGWYHYLSNYYA